VENKCTSHKHILSAISVPKIIKVGGNLTKLWQKQFCTVFFRHGVVPFPMHSTNDINAAYARHAGIRHTSSSDDFVYTCHWLVLLG